MKKISYLFATLYLWSCSTSIVLAQTELPNPLGKDVTIQIFIGNLIRAALGISGSIALAVFVYGGFLFLLSASDAKNVEKGKNAMLYGVIGLAIIFGSYALVNFVIESLLKASGT